MTISISQNLLVKNEGEHKNSEQLILQLPDQPEKKADNYGIHLSPAQNNYLSDRSEEIDQNLIPI